MLISRRGFLSGKPQPPGVMIEFNLTAIFGQYKTCCPKMGNGKLKTAMQAALTHQPDLILLRYQNQTRRITGQRPVTLSQFGCGM